MLNENAKKWVAALRSGKYLQARRALKKSGGYCCLGVACLVAEAEGIKAVWKSKEYLPASYMEWLGLVCNDGEFRDANGDLDNLAFKNDEEKLTFEQIADLIESEPKGLFVAARASEKGE